MKQCPRCSSRTIVKGVCTHCHFKDQRKVHTMLPPGKEQRGYKPSPWDKVGGRV